VAEKRTPAPRQPPPGAIIDPEARDNIVGLFRLLMDLDKKNGAHRA
jgi:hypothetical protein